MFQLHLNDGDVLVLQFPNCDILAEEVEAMEKRLSEKLKSRVLIVIGGEVAGVISPSGAKDAIPTDVVTGTDPYTPAVRHGREFI